MDRINFRRIRTNYTAIMNMPFLLKDMGATKSKAEGRRLLNGGAVEINGRKAGITAEINDGDILRCGKHFWCKLRTPSITLEVWIV